MAEDLNLQPEYTESEIDEMGDGVYDGWDDDSEEVDTEVDEGSGETETAESEAADQPEEETEEEVTDEAEPEQGEAEGEETPTENTTPDEKKYTLKHLDDTFEYTADEMIPLAQKGLDYDRIREERDSLKEAYPEAKTALDFCNELLANSDYETLEDMIDNSRAKMRVNAEKANGNSMSLAHALSEVKAERKAAQTGKVEKKPTDSQEGTQENSPQSADIQSFFSLFNSPAEVPKFEDLPAEVRSEYAKTGKLTAAWFHYQMTVKENEKKTILQNEKNKERATGSRKTVGKGVTKDPLFEGWED